MIADMMLSFSKNIEVVGVDISEKRLSICKKMVKKYILDTAEVT
jgi:ubiquinone/menaquinone biosynthesis C-methylase UbiE